MTLAIYDAKQVSLSWNHVLINAGFADGEFITADYDGDFFSLHIGTDGFGTRSKSNNESAKFTVRLSQGSPFNNYFSEMLNNDRTLPNGAGVGAFIVRDLNGSTLIQAPNTWIVKPPPQSFDKVVKDRVWPFQTEKAVSIIGGLVVLP